MGAILNFVGYIDSCGTPARSAAQAFGTSRRVFSSIAVALLAAALLVLGSGQAQAFPFEITSNDGKTVQWPSLESEWGYKIAVSDQPRADLNRTTDYFEQPVTADPQTFRPIASQLNFVPVEGRVYVGVGPLATPHTSPAEWSTNEALVAPVMEAPSTLILSADSESVSWNSVATGEWGYKIAVSNLPRNTPGRITAYFVQARGSDPQTFKPNPTQLPFTPLEEHVYVGVGTVAVSGESPDSYTAGEAVLRIPAAIVMPPENPKPENPKPHVTPPPPPVNTSPPSTSGTAIVGDDLTASPGGWQGEPAGYTYQWQMCDGGGNACDPISGATGTAVSLTNGEVGHRLRVIVTANNAYGNTSAVSAPSAVVGTRVGASMEWTFGWSSAGWTKVQSLQVLEVPPEGVVEVACHGHGCPFTSKRVAPSAQTTSCRTSHCRHAGSATQVNLAHLFKGRRLPGGTVILVRIVKPGWIGRIFTFTLRTGRNPRHTQACLAPNSTQPIHC
jgi:hypothetical protein